jgi:hypothetical protein
LPNEARKNLDVRAGRYFRDHSTVGAVRIALANDRLGEDATLASDQRRSTVVTATLKAKDHSHFATGPLP